MVPLPPPELIDHLCKAGPRYTSYPPATTWTPMEETEALGALAVADRESAPLSLYVHLPFCEEMCRFCGCNVIATRDRGRADTYLDTLEQEMALWARALPNRRTFGQLHWGGGTPTFLTAPQLERLYAMIRSCFSPVGSVEQAVEIDPVSTTVEQMAVLGRLGFNRMSVGVQDFAPEVQNTIHRLQSPEQTELIIQAGRQAGVKSVNVDLLYGLPYQTPATFRSTIDRVLAMKPDRLALFGYAHVPWAKPNQRLLPQAALPGPHARIELFVMAAQQLERAGYRQIGLDHFARPEDELALAHERGTLTRNFQGYSATALPETLAMGVSAISDLGGAFLQSAHMLREWDTAVRAGRLPIERGRWRTADDELRGAFIRTIMCYFRVDVPALAARYGRNAWNVYGNALPGLRALDREGVVKLRPEGFDVTDLGRLFVRNVAMEFDAYLPPPQAVRAPAFSATV